MFARVITAQTGPEGFDRVIGFGREQLPGASQQPGSRASTCSPTLKQAGS
jgi:hypothetical protein